VTSTNIAVSRALDDAGGSAVVGREDQLLTASVEIVNDIYSMNIARHNGSHSGCELCWG